MGYFVKADTITVIPASIVVAAEAEVISTVQVTMVTGVSYTLVTDTVVISSLLRISELFTFTLTTAIATVDIDVFRAQLLTQIQTEVTELSTTVVEVEIVTQFEQITQNR